jgi:signal transduction histidine kinase
MLAARGGLGLGLALVKSLVEMQGGSITAHSDGLGTGSQFIVPLPACSPDGNPLDIGRLENFRQLGMDEQA